jgi:metal-sulfur cluster biosynthetic enzyme
VVAIGPARQAAAFCPKVIATALSRSFALPEMPDRRIVEVSSGGRLAMRDNLICELPAGYDGSAILDRLAQVLDPELDESILDLGFVRSLRLRSGHASIALQLPTNWCAVNFAYLMAEDVRQALLTMDGVSAVSVSLGDHCAAAEIETAVNAGRPFAEAFSGEGAGSLAILRLTFQRKGFISRQERLLRDLLAAGCAPPTICALRLGEVSAEGEAMVIRQSDSTVIAAGTATLLRRYLERRTELGLDCNLAAPLFVDLDGRPFSVARLQDHYEAARTLRVALEANGLFCRALLGVSHADTGRKSGA